MDDFDPVLIISPNQNLDKPTFIASLSSGYVCICNQNKCRDENSFTVFHFATVTEMYILYMEIISAHVVEEVKRREKFRFTSKFYRSREGPKSIAVYTSQELKEKQ
ncbi:hypothetical protein RclHR1_03000003 [Rhizophagus clarus]|uniref:Uncharacterized protein n=1 Tax=Rhizophagus clarus TaxID=94130 RepID=A0A2Z6R630_9GLOM|nr:hypothetical protein RclHR1_03000003 [Rhizophagus clarus]GES84797.1 hypothetical protein RCL_jg24144.t1 [Rhizophagus clarus]